MSGTAFGLIRGPQDTVAAGPMATRWLGTTVLLRYCSHGERSPWEQYRSNTVAGSHPLAPVWEEGGGAGVGVSRKPLGLRELPTRRLAGPGRPS